MTYSSFPARHLSLLVGIALALAGPRPAAAAPVRDYPVTLEQPDGTKVLVLLTGDEFYNWAHDADGYVIVRNPGNGRLVYATEVNGDVAPTDYVINKVNPRFIGLKPNIAAKHASQARLLSPIVRQLAKRSDAPKGHNTGTFTNLVVFIRFADEAATAFTHTLPEYDAMLNGPAGTNSMRNYYRETSYDTLTINSLYYPTQSGSTIVSFQDSHPRAYYLPYNATTNPAGYQNNSGTREDNLLTAALSAVKATVDAAGIVTDSDHDGFVDNVAFVIDGNVSPWGTLLWPHMSWLGSGPTLGGATVGTYNLHVETFIFGGRGVGVLCHEMFHSLGAPDLYHYSDHGGGPVGIWDLMGADQNPPQHMTAYMKWRYGKWIADVPEITASGHYTLNPTTSSINNCYKIKSPASLTQYFMVEYRRKTGLFEYSLPGSGLIVYRIDPTVRNGNAYGPPDGLRVYSPGGTPESSGYLPAAYFSADVGRTAINSTTDPAPFLQDGSNGMLNIRNVTSAGDTISFDITVINAPSTRVGFLVQPGPMKPGAMMSPRPVVGALTDIGAVAHSYNGAVTVSLKPGTGTSGGSLSGTRTLNCVNGLATFADLSVNVNGSDYQMTASAGGLASGDSAPFSVTPTGIATERMSISSSHREANRTIGANGCISADGRFVAFDSSANNLVPNDNNRNTDVFVKNLSTGVIQIASVSTAGAIGSAGSNFPSLSSTGDYVVFSSIASNLVAGTSYNGIDVFIHEMLTGVTERVSVSNTGGKADAMSFPGAVSADGRYVAFESDATNIVTDDTNNARDIFVRDRLLGTTERISVPPGGAQANDSSYGRVTISDDGGFVSFQSFATNLVLNDTNAQEDVFVWSRGTHTCERISVATNGTQANNKCFGSSMSPDGRYVVFVSAAKNLLGYGGTTGEWLIYWHDRSTGVTELVSIADGNLANNSCFGPDVSADGRYVAFDSRADNLVAGDTNRTKDVFVHDRQTGANRLVSVSDAGVQGTNYSQNMAAGHSIATGPMFVFDSLADNLVANDENGQSDVFVMNGATNLLTRASAGPGNVETGGGGGYRPAISGNGRYVAFYSNASNLVAADHEVEGAGGVFLRDTYTGSTERVSLTDAGARASGNAPSMSSDARYISFTSATSASTMVAGGSGSAFNIYVRDRLSARTIWASSASGTSPNGNCNSSSLSATGRYIVFDSAASNLVSGDTNGQVDVFWKDLQMGTLKRVSVSSTGAQSNGSSAHSLPPRVSADGRYVMFMSYATNLVPNDTNGQKDIYVYDTTTSTIECVSVDLLGKPGNSQGWSASMSDDGRYVAFQSPSNNLVSSDTNFASDVFVRDRLQGVTWRVSVGPNGVQSTNASDYPSISGDGRFVIFNSGDGNLVSGDNNRQMDTFVYDRATGVTQRVSVDNSGIGGNGDPSMSIGISADGRFAVYESMASNLVPWDANTAPDIFLRGPLWASPKTYVLPEAVSALRIAGGLAKPTVPQQFWLDAVKTGGSPGRIDIVDAIAIARKVVGLDPNP